MVFDFVILIYKYKENKDMKTKKNLTISIDKKLYHLIDDNFSNKSNYVEWVIYQDLLKNGVEEIKKIIL